MGWINCRGVVLGLASCIAGLFAVTSSAQETKTLPAPTPSSLPVVGDLSIPALLPVELVIDVDLGSKSSKTGDFFAFHLAKPIIVGGMEVIPAGTPGRGEVIHAKKGGGGGAPGELVLAAHYLQVGARQLRLRSLRLEPIGNDRMGTVHALNTAAAATIPVASLIGLFVVGGERNLPTGTILPAKTAEAFAIEPPAREAQSATRQALENTNEQ